MPARCRPRCLSEVPEVVGPPSQTEFLHAGLERLDGVNDTRPHFALGDLGWVDRISVTLVGLVLVNSGVNSVQKFDAFRRPA